MYQKVFTISVLKKKFMHLSVRIHVFCNTFESLILIFSSTVKLQLLNKSNLYQFKSHRQCR